MPKVLLDRDNFGVTQLTQMPISKRIAMQMICYVIEYTLFFVNLSPC